MGKVKNLIWDEIEFEPENMTPEHYRLKCDYPARRMAAELEISRQTWSKYANDKEAPRWLLLASAAVYHRLIEF